MTRLLNKLTTVLGEDDPKIAIKELLQRIEEQQENTLMVMTCLERAYRQKNDEGMVEKVSKEADELVEQIDREIIPACSLLASLTKSMKVKSRASSVADSEASQRRKEKEKAEMEALLRKDQLEWEIERNRGELEHQEKELQAVNKEINKRRQELENRIDEELGLEEFNVEYHQLPPQQHKSIENKQLQQETKASEKLANESDKHESRRSDNSDHVCSVEASQLEMPKSQRSVNGSDASFAANNREMHGQLERSQIPIFSGNKMDFQRWNVAFTNCVNMTSISPQFKMLRLEACRGW